jgi:hypothetical protein
MTIRHLFARLWDRIRDWYANAYRATDETYTDEDDPDREIW